jgi:hypothetical protein
MDATENKVVPNDDLPPLPEPWIIDGTTNDPTARHHYAEDQMIDYARTYNAALRADLNDARSNWEAGAEEVQQADLVREQNVGLLLALQDIAYSKPLTANDKQMVRYLQRVAKDALAAAGVTP